MQPNRTQASVGSGFNNLYEDMVPDPPHSSTDVSEPIVNVVTGIPSLFLILSQCSFVLLQHTAQI